VNDGNVRPASEVQVVKAFAVYAGRNENPLFRVFSVFCGQWLGKASKPAHAKAREREGKMEDLKDWVETGET
jgi:hypothetical protein